LAAIDIACLQADGAASGHLTGTLANVVSIGPVLMASICTPSPM